MNEEKRQRNLKQTKNAQHVLVVVPQPHREKIIPSLKVDQTDFPSSLPAQPTEISGEIIK